MKFALCNEMFGERDLPEVCRIVRDLGYDGLELAPFTFCKSAGDMDAAARMGLRSIIEDSGLAVVGLHWLFAGQEEMHTTSPDARIWGNARDYLRELIGLCADLGGEVLVIGSPKQRSLAPGQRHADAWARARDLYASVLDQAAARGVKLCIEPLAPAETDFINTVDEGMRMLREIDHPNFKIHLDVKAMCSEGAPVDEIIRSVPYDDIGHVHVNDSNLYGPGMGAVDYAPIARALDDVGWNGWLSVEVFKYDPDPVTIAARSIEYLHRFWRNDKRNAENED